MNDVKDILRKSLPAAVLRDNYIRGMKYSYEEYLVDFLNNSRLCFDKGNERFIRIKEQAHGEPDVSNSNYEIDFKIFADSNHIFGVRNYSHGIVIKHEGVVFHTESKKQGSIKFYDLINLIRNKKKDFFEKEIYTSGETYKALVDFMNKIVIEKNLLLFLPFQYYFEKMDTGLAIAKIIAECIARDFEELVSYRREKTHKDTFIGFISKDKFILINDAKGFLSFYDLVDTKNSELYCKLLDLTKAF